MSSSSSDKSTYFLERGRISELARQLKQDEWVRGVLPTTEHMLEGKAVHDMLDLGCGAGIWVREAAKIRPFAHVIGVDIDNEVLDFAKSQANIARLENTEFITMNILEGLDFPSASFDLIHARFMGSFMLISSWEPLLRECFRVLRPGGIVHLIEQESETTSGSPAYDRFAIAI